MRGPEIPVAAWRYLWDNTAVPLFVERFILVVLAALFIAVAITNPMRLDTTQRVTAAVAIVFAAYFIAHTLYNQIQPKVDKYVDADILQIMPITLPNRWWVVDTQQRMASPVDFFLLIRLTSLDDAPLVVDDFKMEVLGNGDKWIKINVLTNGPVWKAYGGQSLNSVFRITTDPADIWQSLTKTFSPKEPRLGIALCQFTTPNPDIPPDPNPRFRIVIRDAKRRLSIIEPAPVVGSSNMIQSSVTTSKDVSDFSAFPEQRLPQ